MRIVRLSALCAALFLVGCANFGQLEGPPMTPAEFEFLRGTIALRDGSAFVARAHFTLAESEPSANHEDLKKYRAARKLAARIHVTERTRALIIAYQKLEWEYAREIAKHIAEIVHEEELPLPSEVARILMRIDGFLIEPILREKIPPKVEFPTI